MEGEGPTNEAVDADTLTVVDPRDGRHDVVQEDLGEALAEHGLLQRLIGQREEAVAAHGVQKLLHRGEGVAELLVLVDPAGEDQRQWTTSSRETLHRTGHHYPATFSGFREKSLRSRPGVRGGHLVLAGQPGFGHRGSNPQPLGESSTPSSQHYPVLFFIETVLNFSCQLIKGDCL